MRVRWLVTAVCIPALVVGISACGGKSGGGGTAKGKTLTIYSSLPLQGTSRGQSLDVIKGEQLALAEAGNKAGKCKLTYQSLDDSTAQAGQWDPGQTSSNARKASQDQSAIAYLGEFNSGASAISIPILNQAGILQVSPSNTALQLTKNPGPAGKGAPGIYYPTGKRNYARVVPADHIQGAAQADWMKQLGVKKLYVLNDKQVYGAGVATTTAAAAKLHGIQVLGNEGIDPKAPNYRSLAAKIKATGADAVFYGGITANNAAQLFKDLAAGLPNAKLFGPDGVAEDAFTKAIPPAVQKRTYITVATIAAKDYPPAGQKFFKDFKAKYGGKEPQPYAIYGFEAMSLTLDAMNRAGANCNNRQDVINAVFSTKNRPSVLGTYSIDKDGDTTLNDFGRYIVTSGNRVIVKAVKVLKDAYGKPLGGG